MLAWIITIAHILGLLSSIHAVMYTRTPQGAIAWAMSLLAVPYLAVPAYWIFGRSKFQGYITAHRKSSGPRDVAKAAAMDHLNPFLVPTAEQTPTTQAAQILAHMPALKGNRIELLVDGEATFQSIIEGIQQAKSYILFQFYIVRNDQLGTELKNLLCEKSKQGVRVYFMYDEIGSYSLPSKFINELRTAGVEATAFNTRKGRGNKFQINFRNHRKVVIVDGKLGWVGGHNVGDEYLGKNPKIGRWRDTHIKIEGPTVAEAQVTFLEDWHWATDQILELNWKVQKAKGGNCKALVIPTGPADDVETANLMFVHAINSAMQRIWIASPYFVPDHSITVALQLACFRGVDVRILIPDKPDSLLVNLAAYSYFDEITATGARVFRYTDGFLHEKAMLIDDSSATVGTANFDNRSFRLNFEVTAVVSDLEFNRSVEAMFEEDFKHSIEIQADEYRNKPWWFRLGVRLASLTSPIQ